MGIIALLNHSKWVPFGPAPIDSPGTNLGRAAGRIGVAAPHPTNANMMYIGGSDGGVWKTGNWTNSTPLWLPLSDDQASLDFSGYHSLVVHPADPDLVLGLVSGTGGGVLKSTNGGLGWQIVGNGTFEGGSLGSIAVHPTDPQVLYVAVWSGGPGGGVYKSKDGGHNWTNLTASFHSGGVCDVIMASWSHHVLFAGMVSESISSVSSAGVYKSSDSGATWQVMTSLPSSFFLLGAVRLESSSSKNRVYASLFSYDGNGVQGVHRFRTKDGGQTWKQLAATPGSTEFRAWHLVLGVDPNDHEHIFANDEYALFESTDSGEHWSAAETIGDDWCNMAFDARGDVVVTADRDIYHFNAKKKKWSSREGNLQVTQFYDIALDPADPNVAYGVAQDHSDAMKYTGSVLWAYMPGGGGETGKVLVDPVKTNRIYVSDPLDPDNFVRRSSNGGQSWKTIFDTNNFSAGDYGLAYSAQKSFVMDPTNPSRLLIGATKVFETKNATANRPTWAAISHVLSNSSDVADQHITALAIAPSHAKTVYAATADGRVSVTTDGGSTWKKADHGLHGANAGRVVDLRIDPASSKRAVGVTTGQGGVWHMENSDGVLTWTNIGGDLPATVRPATIFADWTFTVPALYLGTSRGVYHSVNLGQHWKKFGLDMPNTAVSDLQSFAPKAILAAATLGRGAWEILISASKISGKVVEDTDGDGHVGAKDPRLPGVTVYLDVSDGALTSPALRTITDDRGRFAFDKVPPGSYVLRQVPPLGCVQTSRALGIITVGGSDITGRDFANHRLLTPVAGAHTYQHVADLATLEGRRPGQPIGARNEFERRPRVAD